MSNNIKKTNGDQEFNLLRDGLMSTKDGRALVAKILYRGAIWVFIAWLLHAIGIW